MNTKIKEEVLECYWHSRASLCDQEITLQYFFYTKKALRILRLYCNWKMSISVSEMTIPESFFYWRMAIRLSVLPVHWPGSVRVHFWSLAITGWWKTAHRPLKLWTPYWLEKTDISRYYYWEYLFFCKKNRRKIIFIRLCHSMIAV